MDQKETKRMEDEILNIAFWESVEKTDPKFTKAVNYGGRRFTAIDPYFQMKNLTRNFGRYGDGWWIENEEYKISDNFSMLMYFALLHLKGVAHPLPLAASINMRDSKGNPVQDLIKKVRTDALTKEITKMGYNSDIFMGKFEDSKYVSNLEQEFRSAEKDKYSLPSNQQPKQPVVLSAVPSGKKEKAPEKAPSEEEQLRKFYEYVDGLKCSDEVAAEIFRKLGIASEKEVPKNARWPFYLFMQSYAVEMDRTELLNTISKDGYLYKNTSEEIYTQVMSIKNNTPLNEMSTEALLQIYRSLSYMLVMEAIQAEKIQQVAMRTANL